MEKSKVLISQALSTLKGNMERTGDPLGFKHIYWNQWAKGLDIPRNGKNILFTARMYQMLPYVTQTTEMVASIKPLLAIKGVGKIINLGNRLAGEQIIRFKAKGAKQIQEKEEKVLKGIVGALKRIDQPFAYLYEAEPYSGVLLYDLGLEADIEPHIKKVYKDLKDRGVEQVITVDPHTTVMMKEVYPKYIKKYDISVKHYLELLSEREWDFRNLGKKNLPKQFVMHDSCVMTRDLGIVEQARDLIASMGIELLEPENTKLDTACCGGPIEYAFADLSRQISSIRIQELASVCKDIIVTCPICLINLIKYEQQFGVRVWDMGEILYAALISGFI